MERLAIEISSGRRRDEFEIDKDAMNKARGSRRNWVEWRRSHPRMVRTRSSRTQLAPHRVDHGTICGRSCADLEHYKPLCACVDCTFIRASRGLAPPLRRNRKGRRHSLKAGLRRLVPGSQHSNFRRSLEDFRLRQVDLALQFPPLHYSRCSSRKKVACAPPGMAIEDVPFKRAVRARMPPHVEEPWFAFVYRTQRSVSPHPGAGTAAYRGLQHPPDGSKGAFHAFARRPGLSFGLSAISVGSRERSRGASDYLAAGEQRRRSSCWRQPMDHCAPTTNARRIFVNWILGVRVLL